MFMITYGLAVFDHVWYELLIGECPMLVVEILN